MADPSAKHTILVVDDSPDSLQLLNAVLKQEFKVRLASSGAQALKAAAQQPRPDAILLDVMMPDMDGYEVCERLKAEDLTREIPVIFLTAKTEIEDAQRGFDVGGADYITKPILPPVVVARLRTHVLLKVARDFIKSQRWV